MHDPDTLVKSLGPFCLWHHDPCTDHTDDSCGWFMRARHGDPKVLKAIESDFAFEWNASYQPWFTEQGDPALSTMGIALQMFRIAAWNHFSKDRKKVERYMRKHLYDILHFAENTCDTMATSIQGKYGECSEPKKNRVRSMASMVYGCVLRDTRPWWKAPRWHVHHWRITCRLFWRRAKNNGTASSA